ncbi:MAG: hypothetical protein IT439_07480 [Phycisphaerales bacterium]|nr:hypothetical protein [Phycisphaerales bacterium]
MTESPARFEAGVPVSQALSNTALILASCGVVSTGYYLGASWLATPVLGIPLGLFALPLVYAGARWGGHVRLRSPRLPAGCFAGLRARLAEAWSQSHPWAGASAPSAAAGSDRCPDAPDGEGSSEHSLAPVGSRLSADAWQPRRRTASQARLGVSEDLASAAEPFARLATWVRVESGSDPQATLRAHDLDALLTKHGQGFELVSASETGDDWTRPTSHTYAGVFPATIEPGTMRFGPGALNETGSAELLTALAESVATFAFARCTSAGAPGARAGLAHAQAEESMVRLRDLVIRAALCRETGPVARAAASGVSAWLAVWNGDCDPASRLDAFEACVVSSGRETGVLFRAAAGRFAAGRESDAFVMAREAASPVRPAGDALNQLPFVQSEVELGAPGDVMLLGRVASGLHLCAALLDAPARAHLQDDVLDDMRYSPWLVGRDDARLLLMRVLRSVSAGPGSTSASQAA